MDFSNLLVVEDHGRIVGSVTFYPDSSHFGVEACPEDCSGVRLLAVHPDARGRGIGRALMDECIRRSQAMGSRALCLHTTPVMNVAIGMYERLGVVRVPKYDVYLASGVLVMAYCREV